MAKLDRPLFGEYATGTLGRALAYRRTANPSDEPGIPAIYWGTVAKIPIMSCGPSPGQVSHRSLFAAAVASWHALTDDERSSWRANKPADLTGWNFFLQLFLTPELAYFGYCAFGLSWFQLGTAPDQPSGADYDSLFPTSIDEFPVIEDGAHSPQAWLWNRAYSAMLNIENYLILNRASIEG
jgi:hypothetical protein